MLPLGDWLLLGVINALGEGDRVVYVDGDGEVRRLSTATDADLDLV